MKRLLLLSSSSFLKNDLSNILGKPLSAYRLAHIIDASQGKGVVDVDYLDRARNILTNKGVEFSDVELTGKNEDEVRTLLTNFDGVFVNGGSTFRLLKSIRESGFQNVLKKLLPSGFLYIGASAGSYVVCPNINTALWEEQIFDHCGLEDFSAMNLVPFLMFAHYKPRYEELIREKVSGTKYPVKILSDDQALFVQGDTSTLLGGEEIVIV